MFNKDHRNCSFLALASGAWLLIWTGAPLHVTIAVRLHLGDVSLSKTLCHPRLTWYVEQEVKEGLLHQVRVIADGVDQDFHLLGAKGFGKATRNWDLRLKEFQYGVSVGVVVLIRPYHELEFALVPLAHLVDGQNQVGDLFGLGPSS